jgi:hypothetical protein
MMKAQVLYKCNGSDESTQFLNIVRYLYTKGYDIRADVIVEKNFPVSLDKLPMLTFGDGTILNGILAITNYYEQRTNIYNLMEKSALFDQLNPDYRITLPYTHRNLKS